MLSVSVPKVDTPRILIVDDSEDDALLMEGVLRGAGIKPQTARVDSAEAMRRALDEEWDLVISDHNMPNFSSQAALEVLQSSGREIPFIIVSGDISEDTALNAMQRGTRDYLSKSNLARLAPVVERELNNSRKANQGKVALEALSYLNNYDTLTGLINRSRFVEALEQAVARRPFSSGLLGLLQLDVDRFKLVNDGLGHDGGDRLLKQIAERLAEFVPKNGSLARIGGDEFAIVLEHFRRPEQLLEWVERLRDGFGDGFVIDGCELMVTLSIGVSIERGGTSTPAAMLRQAEAAMYRCKEQGGNGYQFYTEDMQSSALETLSLERDLYRALELEQFELYFQPKVDVADGRLVGAEALLRWNHPERGMVSPMDFIPLAETSGLIVEIDYWVIQESCRLLADWRRRGLSMPRIAINLSGRQFREPYLAEQIIAILNDHGLPSDCLEIEITECTLIDDVETTIAILNGLHRHGLRVAVDDFGTGYSSLSYLRQFPIDTLKIDRSFVADINTSDSHNAGAIVRSIIALARNLNLGTVAEGVEDESQLAFLRGAGCDQAQGYLFDRPLQVADLEKRISNG